MIGVKNKQLRLHRNSGCPIELLACPLRLIKKTLYDDAILFS